ncbi:MAG: GWxTD domain-containing protein [Thermoanaerobaculia bacterium]
MSRNTFAVFTSALLFASLLAAQSLPDLFKQAQVEFQQGKHEKSLATLDQLEKLSQAPGHEADREKLVPVIAFFRGANDASLGRHDEGVEQFQIYLKYFPTARLDSSKFPQKVIEVFDDARKTVEAANSTAARTLEGAYGIFHVPPGQTIAADENWARTPVRYFMTAAETSQWKTLKTDDERQKFVDDFWKKRDPDPSTPANEFRAEIERRILFSDAAFTVEDEPGRYQDRALVFTVMGPPNIATRTQLRDSDDPIDAMRSGTQGQNLGAGHQTAGSPSSLHSDFSYGMMDKWTYRKDHLAKVVSFPELEISFITKRGYGAGVMQKDAKALQALDATAAQYRK